MNQEQNKYIIDLFERFHTYTKSDYGTPFKIFSVFGSLALGFFTAHFAPEFTQNFIENEFLTLSMVVIGFYLATTVASLRYKNQFIRLAKENQDQISEDQKSQMNFLEQFWFYYIEMGPMLTFIQAWFFIIFRELSQSPTWFYVWSSLIIWSFLALVTLLFKRYVFMDQLLKHDDILQGSE